MFKYFVLTILATTFWGITVGQTEAAFKEETHIYEKIYNAPIKIDGEQLLELHQISAKKPLFLALIFTRCTGVCNPFIMQLKENLQLRKEVENFQVLVLSFDPRDSLKDMQRLAQRYDLENSEQWLFGTTDEIDLLNESIGFSPTWDPVRQQFDHDALLVGINTEGYITKKLIGIRQRQDLDLLIASVNNVFSPTYRIPNKNMLFSCFNYDPITGKNKFGLGMLFIALPAVLTVVLLITLSLLVRRKKKLGV